MANSEPTNVLLIGGGGREHALAAALKKSKRLGELWTSHPENPGIAALAKAVDVPVNAKELYRVVQFCEAKKIGMVVIGPEEPLAQGYADKLISPDRMVFGPTQAAAQLEADKVYAKQVMRSAAIPTADARTFTDFENARQYLNSRLSLEGRGNLPRLPVIKASGLAKGKGVLVPNTVDEAIDALDRIMLKKEFGDAGNTVLIEERLEGPEVSILAIVDGSNILLLPPAQDHKRLLDGDKGPNTGGMGAFCPSAIVDAKLLSQVEREILVPIVDAMRRDDIIYRGVLYVGLMLTPSGPKVLEFNCRFGDPECQVIIPRLKSDLLELMQATATGRLHKIDVEWDARASCCVVMASEGYPEKPRDGQVITGLGQAAANKDVTVFHAGTKRNAQGEIVTAGGRVLGVTALGTNIADARQKAYAACDKISFPGMQYRKDIGTRGG